jgi:hypothetical protein
MVACVTQQRPLFTESPLSNGSIRHKYILFMVYLTTLSVWNGIMENNELETTWEEAVVRHGMRNSPGIVLEGLRKTTINFSQICVPNAKTGMLLSELNRTIITMELNLYLFT